MDWITFIWGFIAAIYFSLGWIHLLILLNSGNWRRHLLFVCCAASAALMAICELCTIKLVTTPDDYTHMLRFGLTTFSAMLLSSIWFVHNYTGLGRLWLAVLFTAMRLLILVVNFTATPSFHFKRIDYIVRLPFVDGSFPVPIGVTSRWVFLGNLSLIVLFVYCVDCIIRVWRSGERQRAILVGGSASLFGAFTLFQGVFGIYGFWGAVFERLTLSMPTYSVFYLGVAIAISFEISHEVIRATHLTQELRENERRLALAIEAADLDIWTYDLRHDRLWLSPRTRRLLDISEDAVVGLGQVLERLPEDDRRAFEEAINSTIKSSKNFEVEYRFILPNGQLFWIVSRGELETGQDGKPVRIRGASIDITSRKMAEDSAIRMSGLLIRAQEEERARLARELHDDLSQRLALHSIELDLLGEAPPADPVDFEQKMRILSTRVTDLSNEIHKLSHDLHPAKLRRLGLVPAARGFCRDFGAIHDIDVRFSATNVPQSLEDDLALCLYRIIQESLRNVARHSGAASAVVELQCSGQTIQLSIADDGCGFDPAEASHKHSLGIISMKERARLVGGKLRIETSPGNGTAVIVTITKSDPETNSPATPGQFSSSLSGVSVV